MGRRQYLERLALGRSAYQDAEAEQLSPPAHGSSPEVTGHEYVQKYDSRGRPVNPKIEEFNAEQRKAQNAVLALVGIVERKEEMDQSSGLRYRAIQEARRDLLKEEQDRGEVLEYLIYAASFLLHLWPDALLQRVQIGLYDTSRSFADILSAEWADMYRGGFQWSLAKRFPGGIASMVHAFTRVGLVVGAEYLVGELQDWVMRSRLSRRTRERVHKGLARVLEGLVEGICILLMPLEYYAAAQRLGVAPARPALPGLRSFLPAGYAGSLHPQIWKGAFKTPALYYLTSPGAFFLAYRMLMYDAEDSIFPVFHLLTDFKFPVVDEDPAKVIRPRLLRDPLGWVLYQCYCLRSRFMQHSGWTVIKRSDGKSRDREEDNIRSGAGGKESPIHRSTVMAHLPAQFLTDALDGLFCRILNLPFEATMMRTIAINYLASSGVDMACGLSGASFLYAPFSRGPCAEGWPVFGQYVGRIGLSLALAVSVDVVTFHAIYTTVRSMGTQWFDWGRKGKIGQVIYSEEGFPALESEAELDQVH